MKKQDFNDLIFDGMLKLAAEEFLQDKVNEFNSIPDEKHEFSPQFNQRMRKILKSRKKADKPLFKSIMTISKRVAVVILLIISITSISLLSVKAIRTEVYKIFMSFYEKYIDVSFMDEKISLPSQAENINDIYFPSYIPEGYIQNDFIANINMVTGDYINQDNNIISYSQGLLSKSVSIDGEDYTMYETSINGVKGIIYEYDTKGTQNTKEYIIIWSDDKYYYMLNGNIEVDELLKMANSLEVQ